MATTTSCLATSTLSPSFAPRWRGPGSRRFGAEASAIVSPGGTRGVWPTDGCPRSAQWILYLPCASLPGPEAGARCDSPARWELSGGRPQGRFPGRFRRSAARRWVAESPPARSRRKHERAGTGCSRAQATSYHPATSIGCMGGIHVKGSGWGGGQERRGQQLRAERHSAERGGRQAKGREGPAPRRGQP